MTGGTPAQYIPQLAKADVSKWGVSVCSVDGQRFNIGDTKTPVSANNQQWWLELFDLNIDVYHSAPEQWPREKKTSTSKINPNESVLLLYIDI